MSTTVVNAISDTVSEKIPKFLYHMTSKKNYKAIMKDGFLRPKSTIAYGKGIFTFDLINLFTEWPNYTDKITGEKIINGLLMHVNKKNDKVVLLKIPTSKLNCNNLKIRSQNRLFNTVGTDFSYNEAKPEADILANLFNRGAEEEEKDLSNKFYKEILKDNGFPDVDHCFHGAPAKEAYKYEKEALEYIYDKEIPVSDIKKIGSIDLGWHLFSKKTPIKGVFDKLLKGTPEAEATKILSC